MQDWIELLIAFVLGFFMKMLLGTMCSGHLVEGCKNGFFSVLSTGNCD